MDKFITQILAQRVTECYINEGPYDGFDKCRKLDDEYEKTLTNYFIKCKSKSTENYRDLCFKYLIVN